MQETESGGTLAGQAVLLVVDDDAAALRPIERALVRRFGADYRVLTAATPEAGLETLSRLTADGTDVALVAADIWLAGMDGVEFLERAHALHPGARRALLIERDHHGTRLPVDPLARLQRATALGQVDFSIVKGWVSPEEWFYPQMQEALSAWAKMHRPRFESIKLIGERWAPRSHELRELVSRNTVPSGFYEADSEAGRRLLAKHGLDPARLPVAVLYDGRVIVEPTNVQLAEALGVRTRPDPGPNDVVIVGAGPAGLAAAVYSTSEGLETLVIEPEALGGQAGTSSMIRNYLGFPRGLSGGELTSRAYEQAMLFGAQFVFMRSATDLTVRGDDRVVTLVDGSEAVGRAVVIATGMTYRRLDIPALDRLLGAGVYYGAAGTEARAMAGQEVFVVGAGNSAGQAALHLAKFAARVTILVRGDSLASSMSEYLITEIEATPNVEVRIRTQVVDGRGEYRLEGLVLEDAARRTREVVPAAALFVLIGAAPHTAWLGDTVERDATGYILTGQDITPERWPLARSPMPLETSIPGVFAVGDVRHGSVKRVASAVGEGSVAVRFVHEHLAAIGARATAAT